MRGQKMKKICALMVSCIFLNIYGIDIDKLLYAISCVESGNDTNAVGKKGEIGALQIKKILIDDVNRIIGDKKFNYFDRKNRQKSYEIAKIYFSYYALNYRLKTGGLIPDAKFYIKIWKYGPKGYIKPDCDYTERVYNLYAKGM